MRPTAQLRSLYLQAGNVDAISLRSIISTLGANSFALLLQLFATLSIVLTPVPGQATILCFPMTLLAWQWLKGRRSVHLPIRAAAQTIPTRHFRAALKRALPVLVWLESRCSKRMENLQTDNMRLLARTTLFLLCMALIIPIPLTHIMPDIAIIIIALGELERDGLMLMIGVLLGLLTLASFIVVGMMLMGGLATALPSFS